MASVTAQRTFQVLENQSLWETAAQIHALLAEQSISHAVVGGVAVCLHGYRRNTVDLDLLIRPDDVSAIRTVLEGTDYRGATWIKSFSRVPAYRCSSSWLAKARGRDNRRFSPIRPIPGTSHKSRACQCCRSPH